MASLPSHDERADNPQAIAAAIFARHGIDFAAVQRQAEVLGLPFDADGFLAQLESEHRVKPEVRLRRGIGFV